MDVSQYLSSTLSSPFQPLEFTVVEPSDPGCEKDCREIHAARDRLSHLGLSLAWRTPVERRRIKETYRAMFDEDLVEHLRSVWLSDPKNEMCDVLYMWVLEAHERDALVARVAHGCDGGEVDYKALVEIYARRKSNQLFLTKQAYLAMFKRHLEQDIIPETVHPFQRILGALATSQRSHHSETSNHIAKCDAKKLYEAGEGSAAGGIDEPTILEIFSKRSIPQLRLAITSYKHIYGHSYTKALKRQNSGEFEDCLRVVINCMHQPSKYYSKMLYMSLKGTTTTMTMNSRVLSRLMIGAAESGMAEVKQRFEKTYQSKLEDSLCDNVTAGDYRDFLLALTKAPNSVS